MSNLTRETIEEELRECLTRLTGDPSPAEFSSKDSVLNICGLDSQHGVELACDLEVSLSIRIPDKDNPLVLDESDCRKRARTFAEVVDYLLALPS